jgi:hypothetical protein
MGLTREQLVELYPQVFHMAEASSWPSIKRHGLLSTSALLDLFEISGEARFKIESCHRPDSVTISHPKHGTAVIRDQKPMRESALRLCLKGCSPRKWYRFLNRKVFFWGIEERVTTLLNARAYRSRDHIVLTVDTAQLIKENNSKMLLSPLNSGSTIYRPVSRSIKSFRPLAKYPYEERKKARGKKHAIVEFAFDYEVQGLLGAVIRVERRRGDSILAVLE